MSASLPLLIAERPGPIAWWHGRPIPAAGFLNQVAALAARLPAAGCAVNLCEDRYLFMVAFAALLLRGQTNLLPPNRAPAVVAEVANAYAGCYAVVDRHDDGLPLPQHVVALEATVPGGMPGVPELPADLLAAIVFTSGSTGQAQPQRKYWGDLVACSAATQARLGLDALAGGSLVATVPPQHMFGLEMTILLPLLSRMAVHGGRPFFPEDVRQTLLQTAEPRVLVTTPVHLRACIETELEWPALAAVISATAPLAVPLAQQAETRLGCPVQEIYGCSETGAIASRRTALEGEWSPMQGVSLSQTDGATLVTAPFLRRPTPLNDLIRLGAEGCFTLRGRAADMLNMAGKRASLGDLTHRLLEVPGVEDGVLFLPEGGGEVTRLCAFVVAPRLSDAQLQAALLRQFDPVFVPRPIYRVARLPRNASGKLPRADLLALWHATRTAHDVE